MKTLFQKAGFIAFLVLKAWPKRILWKTRWKRRVAKPETPPAVVTGTEVFSRLRSVYINLDHRQDRRRELEGEFKRLGLVPPERFSAIKREFGGLGCSESHRNCMSLDLAPHHLALMICEDDLEFLCTKEELQDTIAEFLNNPSLDVLCIGNASIEKPLPISGRLSLANNIQTTSCYVAKPHAIPHLFDAFDKSVNRLIAGGSWSRHALDQTWKEKQQGELFFAIPSRKLAKQRASFSDIELRDVAYRS